MLGGLQVGGGINSENCLSFIGEGASHVIVTSVCHFYFSISCSLLRKKMLSIFHLTVLFLFLFPFTVLLGI